MKTLIDWKRVWDDFEDWFQEEQRNAPRCSECDHKDFSSPEWEEQERKVQQLVEDQIRES